VPFDLIPHLYYSSRSFTCCKLSHAIHMKQGDSLFNTFRGLVFLICGCTFWPTFAWRHLHAFDLRKGKSHQTTRAQRKRKATTIYASILFFFFFHDSLIQLYQSLVAELGRSQRLEPYSLDLNPATIFPWPKPKKPYTLDLNPTIAKLTLLCQPWFFGTPKRGWSRSKG